MNIVISAIVLSLLFILYKHTYFFNKTRHRVFQYILIVFLASLALINAAIANNIFKNSGFSIMVGLDMGLAVLLFFSSLKVMK